MELRAYSLSPQNSQRHQLLPSPALLERAQCVFQPATTIHGTVSSYNTVRLSVGLLGGDSSPALLQHGEPSSSFLSSADRSEGVDIATWSSSWCIVSFRREICSSVIHIHLLTTLSACLRGRTPRRNGDEGVQPLWRSEGRAVCVSRRYVCPVDMCVSSILAPARG